MIDLIKGRKEVLEIHERIKGKEVTGSICVYELSKFAEKNPEPLFKDKEVIPLSLRDAETAGEIYQQLSIKGEAVGEIDTIIAGIVKNRDLVLVSRDQDFKRISDIQLLFYEIKTLKTQ